MESARMDYRFTAVLIVLMCLLALFATPAYPGSTQTNTSGSNTAIEGGYTSTATTTYQSGSSSNTTTNSTTNSNIKSAPPTAAAPTVTNSGSDVCLAGASAGVQTFGIGVSAGKSFRDKNCERIKLSRELNSLGMKVAAVAILCQDPRVFASMEHAGTPCPYEGSIGKAAKAKWKKYGKLRPDYELYVKNLQIKEEADEEEQKQITKDLTKMDSERQIHDVQVKQNIEWKKPK
jgi:hypothetical protein